MTIEQDVQAIGRIDVVPTILEVVCRTTGMGFAAIARVTEDRWVACAVRDEIQFGLLPGGELAVATTICHEIRQSGRPVVIDHVAEDDDFRGHPTPAQYGFQSYISMPIFHGDQFFGTLCAIDPNPAHLKNPATIGMFQLFADLIARHLEVQARLEASEAELIGERQAVLLREEFMAVLGHDLRNPLASIQAGARLLSKTPLNDRAVTLVGAMQSSVWRMAGLIDNLMDLARARLGGGFDVELKADPGLAATLEQAIDELRMSQPTRGITSDLVIEGPVAADGARLAQLLSNLISNALSHGSDNAPVAVFGRTKGGAFELSVANAGAPIPPEIQAGLFQPFARATHSRGKQGLGLGLYIASEIARAHGGTLHLASTEAETRFTFRMPLA